MELAMNITAYCYRATHRLYICLSFQNFVSLQKIIVRSRTFKTLTHNSWTSCSLKCWQFMSFSIQPSILPRSPIVMKLIQKREKWSDIKFCLTARLTFVQTVSFEYNFLKFNYAHKMDYCIRAYGFQKIGYFPVSDFVSLYISWNSTIAFRKNGSLDCSFPPCTSFTREFFSSKLVIAMACGWDHVLLVCSDGSLHSYGWNKDGQLGCGSDSDFLHSPREVIMFRDKAVVGVAAGERHSLAWCTNGQLYSWGADKDGLLGREVCQN